MRMIGSVRILSHAPFSVISPLIMPPQLGIHSTTEKTMPSVCAQSGRSEEHTSELQSLMRISYAVFCLKKKNHNTNITLETTKSTQHYLNTISNDIKRKRHK